MKGGNRSIFLFKSRGGSVGGSGLGGSESDALRVGLDVTSRQLAADSGLINTPSSVTYLPYVIISFN